MIRNIYNLGINEIDVYMYSCSGLWMIYGLGLVWFLIGRERGGSFFLKN